MKKALFAGSLLLLPAVASAQQLTYFKNLLNSLSDLVNAAIPFLIGVALIVFFYGLVRYMVNPEYEEGKKIMIGGLVGLFVMVSVWGIIRLAQSVLGVQSNQQAGQQVQSPRVPR